MKEITAYECDYCKGRFFDKNLCRDCENQHKYEKVLYDLRFWNDGNERATNFTEVLYWFKNRHKGKLLINSEEALNVYKDLANQYDVSNLNELSETGYYRVSEYHRSNFSKLNETYKDDITAKELYTYLTTNNVLLSNIKTIEPQATYLPLSEAIESVQCDSGAVRWANKYPDKFIIRSCSDCTGSFEFNCRKGRS